MIELVCGARRDAIPLVHIANLYALLFADWEAESNLRTVLKPPLRAIRVANRQEELIGDKAKQLTSSSGRSAQLTLCTGRVPQALLVAQCATLAIEDSRAPTLLPTKALCDGNVSESRGERDLLPCAVLSSGAVQRREMRSSRSI